MALFPVPQKKLSADPNVAGSADLFIAEDDSDATAAINTGFAAVGFPNNLRTDENYSTLLDICTKSKRIYILNSSGDTARLGEIGFRLAKEGVAVFVVIVYDEAATTYKSLADYMNTHSHENFKALIKQSKSFLGILISQLPEDLLKASSDIREKIFPIIMKMDATTQTHFLHLISKKVNARTKVIEKMFAELRSNKKRDTKQEQEEVDPEIQAAAMALAHDPQLFRKRIDAVNAAGVVGERKVIALYFATMDSRLIKDTGLPGQNVLAVKSSGHFGAGKSYTLFNCVLFYPEEAIHLITSGSEKSLYYLADGLKHKTLIVTEGFQFQGDRGDSEISYVVRSLLSEGKIIRLVAEKGEDGKITTNEVVIEGPTSFITTTVVESLEPQLEDRMWSIHPNESAEQTKKIIHNTANQRSGNIRQVSDRETKVWKTLHRMMGPVSVVIPFASAIAGYLTRAENVPIAARRAFNKIMNVIQAIACLYQYQRPRDESGNVMANIQDYWMAMQIVEEAFRENLGQTSKVTDERIEYLKTVKHASVKDLAAYYGVSRQAISGWSKRAEQEGLVQWVDDRGNQFRDDNAVKRGKSSGKAHLMLVDPSGQGYGVTGLPLPNDLMDPDPAWAPGGVEYEKYHLHLTPDVPKVVNPTPVLVPVPVTTNVEASPQPVWGNPYTTPPEPFNPSEPDGFTEAKSFLVGVDDQPQPYDPSTEPEYVLDIDDPDYINPLI